MIIEHPPKLGPETQLVGIEPRVWMHVAYGSVGEIVLQVVASKSGPAIYDPMFTRAL